jgi:thiamine transport system substrate-binding protein
VTRRTTLALATTAALATALVGCTGEQSSPAALRLLAYDSFPTGGTPLNDALDAWATRTGRTVEIVTAGDTGTMVAKAALTAGNPEADVIWGVDNTWLSAATDAGIYSGEPVTADVGDVCVNVDLEWFAAEGLPLPDTLDDLIDPAYAGLLAVQDPTLSSPGLAFLLATIAAEGDAWTDYWSALRANDVAVADSWETAYYEMFTRAGGDRPMVVSYGSSPPAEVVFADPPRDDAPTGVVEQTCFRQTEYVGVLAGTDHPDDAAALVTFLTSPEFQVELPLTLFVHPADQSVPLPQVFIDFAVVPDSPWTIDPVDIDANRQAWQEQWTTLMAG